MDVTSAIGLERIQRAVALLMKQNINTHIEEQRDIWEPRDATFYAAMGRPDLGITLEDVNSQFIYSGTIPSLINSPPENYPNICVLAYVGQPQITTDDWADVYAVTVTVEIMVKSHTSEEEVNARIQRTLEAAHSVINSERNRRLPEGNVGVDLVPQMGRGPAVTVGDVFVRHENQNPRSRWFWQGGSLTYSADKFSSY